MREGESQNEKVDVCPPGHGQGEAAGGETGGCSEPLQRELSFQPLPQGRADNSTFLKSQTLGRVGVLKTSKMPHYCLFVVEKAGPLLTSSPEVMHFLFSSLSSWPRTWLCSIPASDLMGKLFVTVEECSEVRFCFIIAQCRKMGPWEWEDAQDRSWKSTGEAPRQ